MIERFSRFVTDHYVSVAVVMVLLTAGVAAGLPQLDMQDQTGIDDDVFTRTDVGQALEYSNAHYEPNDSDPTAVSSVYVRPDDGNVLSREWLRRALTYQETVLGNATVRAELNETDRIRGPPTLVGEFLAGENASLAAQRAAIRNASDSAFHRAVRETLARPGVPADFLPRSYEPGSTRAGSMRIQFVFEQAGVTQQQEPLPNATAQRALYEAAADEPALFTMGTFAASEWESKQLTDVFWLIIPPALLLVLVVLGVAYRDPVDVVLGFVGVALSVVWFFGILGWLGVPAGFASIVGPVLIVALSIDFGLHVFIRYREERAARRATDERAGIGPTRDGRAAPRTANDNAGSEATPEDRATDGGGASGETDASRGGITAPMVRSMRALTATFLLVAVTAAVGFLSNVTSPIGFIRAFGVVITLGVLSAVLLFLTLVPALKIAVEKGFERVGLDRRNRPFGSAGHLKKGLTLGVSIARRRPAVVVVLALVVSAGGLVTVAGIERQGFQEDFVDEGDWQTQLPAPFGWSAHETPYRQHLDYVQANFQSDDPRERGTLVLLRGDVTDTTALERVHAGTLAAADSDVAFERQGRVLTRSPLSVMTTEAVEHERLAATVAAVADENPAFADLVATLAEENPRFGAAVANATAGTSTVDTDGAVTDVYDVMYQVAPGDTASVLERRNGEYRSMRLIIPIEQGVGVNERDDGVSAIADAVEGDTELSAVPVGFATVANAGLGEIADSILATMLVAVAGVAVVLALAFRRQRSSATLGLITVLPIVLVLGLVFGAMYAFDVPLTFLTAFLVNITIGLGIDYSIHVSDRFAHELDGGAEPVTALSRTVVGTGGALLGSALTSVAAFATLTFHPSPTFRSFGIIVVFALLVSFVASVLVFPSLLLLWGRRTRLHRQ